MTPDRNRRIGFAAAASILGTVLILSALTGWDRSGEKPHRPLWQEQPLGLEFAQDLFGTEEITPPLATVPVPKPTRVAAIERKAPSRGRTGKS